MNISSPLHTVVSPPYPIHLGEKNQVKSHSKVESFQSEVPEGESILQILPKILVLGHKEPSRPYREGWP